MRASCRRREGIAAWDAWQITYLVTPQGQVRYRFTDLPTLAAHAKAAGVPAMTLAGAGCARIHASAAAGPKAPVNEAFR